MQPYVLPTIYRDLRRALASGRKDDAARALGTVLGLALPAPSDAALASARDRLDPGLTYRGFKPAELAMVADDLKPVVKLEDIPLPAAHRFAARFGASRHVVATPPYVKDYLLLRTKRASSSPAGPMASTEPLTSLYVSRSDAAERLQQLEAESPDDVKGCGELLGFPPCCVAAFANDFERSRRDQDAVNDDACRRVLATAAACGRGQAEPALNPTSDLEQLGFYPCSLSCAAALAMAGRTARALARRRPAVAERAAVVLSQPVLFWRLPFFLRLDGEAEGDSVIYRSIAANAFPEPAARAAQTLFAACLLPILDCGDRLVVRAGALDVLRGDRRVATVDFDPALPPLAVGWRAGSATLS